MLGLGKSYKMVFFNTNRKTTSEPGRVPVLLYSEEYNGMIENCDEMTRCETVCNTLSCKLEITPALLHCFNLCIFDKRNKRKQWISPSWTLSDVSKILTSEMEVHFRMRFIPSKSKILNLDEHDRNCFIYLVWQITWDFLHDCIECFMEETQVDEARGFSCILILIKMRQDTERNNNGLENVKHFIKVNSTRDFLPAKLQKTFIEKKILKNQMTQKCEELQNKYPPSPQYDSVYLMRWYVTHILGKNSAYYTERFMGYELIVDTEEFESIDEEVHKQIIEKNELSFCVTREQSIPWLSITKTKDGEVQEMLRCSIESIAQIEMKSTVLDGHTWWGFQLFRQDGHLMQMLYFESDAELKSFVTCIECYGRLVVDFYSSLCHDVEPLGIIEQNRIRAHGPVSKEYVMDKLVKKNSKELYLLRSSPSVHSVYEVFYLPNVAAKLRMFTLPKIIKEENGYKVEGRGEQPVDDLKGLLNRLIQAVEQIPASCQRIKPQSEDGKDVPAGLDLPCLHIQYNLLTNHPSGCDVLQNLLLENLDLLRKENEEEQRERKRLENQPKIYLPSDVRQISMIGRGHFTEAYKGVLCEQDQIVMKRLRSDIPDVDFRKVQESFHEGLQKLMLLGDPQHFTSYLGMLMSPVNSMLLRGTSFGSLRLFLQVREPDLPMLTLHHLFSATIQLASTLVFMEEKNCYHGNLRCENIAVMSYDHRDLVVRVTDPGLVSLYNKLPLDHPINQKRIPWLAPELHHNLQAVNSQKEVFAFGTTLWQMFSEGFSPLQRDAVLKNKSHEQILQHFTEGRPLSCPLFLKERKEDSPEITKVKVKLYDIMKSCWLLDPEERVSPKSILREVNSNVQSYEETYHKYNIIPYMDLTSAASYPMDSGTSSGTRQQSSGFPNSGDTVAVPDLSCLSAENRQASGSGMQQVLRPNNSNVSTAQQQSIQRPVDISPALQSPQRPVDLSQLSQSPVVGPQGAAAAPLPSLPTARNVIDETRLKIDKRAELGKGHYGEVYKAKLYPPRSLKGLSPEAEPEIVVVKVLKPDMVAKYSEDFRKEAVVMERLSHKNIVKFYGICRGGAYLVMEYVANNSLHKYVVSAREDRSIAPETFLQFAVDIAAGMEYLELQKVIHCDLAARNILLTHDLHAKISDFGLSKILTQDKDYYKRSEDKIIPILWCAPEWIEYKKFTSKSDVWSFGVVLWEMYSYGKPPYLCNHVRVDKIIRALHAGDRLKKPNLCPKMVYDLMKECWDIEEKYRPNFEACRQRFEKLYAESTGAPAADPLPSASNSADIKNDRKITQSKPASVALPLKSSEAHILSTPVLNTPEPKLVVTKGDNSANISDETTDSDRTKFSNPLNQTAVEARGVQDIVGLNNMPMSAGDHENQAGGEKKVSKGETDRSDSKTTQEPQSEHKNNETLRKEAPSNDTVRKEIVRTNSVERDGITMVNQSEMAAARETSSDQSRVSESTNQSNILDNGNQSSGSNGRKLIGSQLSSSTGSSRSRDQHVLIAKHDLTYDENHVLGKGSFGKVYKGLYRGEPVAVKRCTESSEYSRFRREYELLYQLKHKSPHIVNFIGLYEIKGDAISSKEHVYVMEYLECGSLYEYLVKQKKESSVISLATKLKFLIDIAKGMDYLFNKSVLHCDLTAKNVLLDQHLNAKISDFGWAKKLENEQDNCTYKRENLRLQPLWAAPEVFEKEIYTRYSDIWSYGVVCIEVFLNGTTPALDLPLTIVQNGDQTAFLQKLYKAIIKGARYPKPSECPPEVYETIKKCWAYDYEKRILYKDVIEEFSKLAH